MVLSPCTTLGAGRCSSSITTASRASFRIGAACPFLYRWGVCSLLAKSTGKINVPSWPEPDACRLGTVLKSCKHLEEQLQAAAASLCAAVTPAGARHPLFLVSHGVSALNTRREVGHLRGGGEGLEALSVGWTEHLLSSLEGGREASLQGRTLQVLSVQHWPGCLCQAAP